VRVKERVDCFLIFDAVERRDVHQTEVMSGKWPVTSKKFLLFFPWSLVTQ
jgi:hypothetical protein